MTLPRLALPGATALFAAMFSTACLAADGQPDPNFGFGGAAYITPDDVEARELRPYAALALPDGKILVAGERNKFIPSSPFDPHMRAMIARLNADGSADDTFGNVPGIPGLFVLPDLVPDTGAGMQVIEAMQRLDDGSIIVAGTAQAFGPLRGFLVKLDAEGAFDGAFGSRGIALLPSVYVHALAVDGDGRLVIAGEKSIDTIPHSFVGRFDANGQPDPNFGSDGSGGVVIDWDGVAQQGGYLSGLGIGGDGSILVGGNYETYGQGLGSDFAIAKLDASGSFDTRFNGTGWRVFHRPDESPGIVIDGIERLLPTAEGGAVFVGHYQLDPGSGDTSIELVLGRVGADGAMDATFGDAGNGFQLIASPAGTSTSYATGFLRQTDGKLVTSVSYSALASSFLAFRTDADGALDAGFGDGGVASVDMAPDGVFSDSSALALDREGRVIVAGMVERGPPLYELAVLRLGEAVQDKIFVNGFDGAR